MEERHVFWQEKNNMRQEQCLVEVFNTKGILMWMENQKTKTMLP